MSKSEDYMDDKMPKYPEKGTAEEMPKAKGSKLDSEAPEVKKKDEAQYKGLDVGY